MELIRFILKSKSIENLSLTFLIDAYTTSADKTTFNPGYQKDMMKKKPQLSTMKGYLKCP